MQKIPLSHTLSAVLSGLLCLSMSLPAWSQNNLPGSTSEQAIETFQMAGDPNFSPLPSASQAHIAVVDFENHTGNQAYENLRRGLSESLMTKLARRPELSIVERNQLDKAVKELGFSQSLYASSDSAKEIGRMAGADYIVLGDIVKAGERFEINVRMIDVETARVLVSNSYGFKSENDTLLVVDYLALLIPQKLGMYVSDRELEMARKRLQDNQAMASGDLTWLWWTLGGVAIIGAAAAVAAIALSGPRQTSTTTIVNNTNSTVDGVDDKTGFGPKPGQFSLPF